MVAQRTVSSRRVRKEKQKAMRQSITMLVLALLTLLLFIFVIIPIFIQGFNSFIDTSNPFQQSDTIPPQVPILSAPVEATFSAQIALSGFAEAESTVVMVLNGERYKDVSVSEDGSFAVDLDLSDGENTIAAYSIDGAGNESELSKTFTTTLDTEDPTLDISSLEDGMTVETRKNQNFTVSGTTDPGVKVFINGRLSLPNSEGVFKQSVLLAEGENLLVIEAIDKAGNTTIAERTVTYIP